MHTRSKSWPGKSCADATSNATRSARPASAARLRAMSIDALVVVEADHVGSPDRTGRAGVSTHHDRIRGRQSIRRPVGVRRLRRALGSTTTRGSPRNPGLKSRSVPWNRSWWCSCHPRPRPVRNASLTFSSSFAVETAIVMAPARNAGLFGVGQHGGLLRAEPVHAGLGAVAAVARHVLGVQPLLHQPGVAAGRGGNRLRRLTDRAAPVRGTARACRPRPRSTRGARRRNRSQPGLRTPVADFRRSTLGPSSETCALLDGRSYEQGRDVACRDATC